MQSILISTSWLPIDLLLRRCWQPLWVNHHIPAGQKHVNDHIAPLQGETWKHLFECPRQSRNVRQFSETTYLLLTLSQSLASAASPKNRPNGQRYTKNNLTSKTDHLRAAPGSIQPGQAVRITPDKFHWIVNEVCLDRVPKGVWRLLCP